MVNLSEKNTDKVEAILSAALEEFLKNGYVGTSMDRLAKVAKVSKPTLYSYFSDKETLFKTVVRQRFTEFNVDFTLLPEDFDFSLDGKTNLKNFLTSLLQFMLSKVEKHDDFIRLVIGESGRFPDLAQEVVKVFHKPTIDKLTNFFIKHPQIKCKNPEHQAIILVASLIYYMMTQNILQAKEILPLDKEIYLDNLINTLPQ